MDFSTSSLGTAEPARSGTATYWMESAPLLEYTSLATDEHVDVVIVGGGITGLSCAYQFAKEGKSVIVLDDGALGSGETSRTTAHITAILDTRYYELERAFGEVGARLVLNSHLQAIDVIETIVREESIACDFQRVDGYLFFSDEASRIFEQNTLQRLGYRGVEVASVDSLPRLTVGSVLKFQRQGQFHPLKYLTGLAEAVLRRKGRMYTNTPVRSISGQLVTTSMGKSVVADVVIVATHTPVSNRLSIHTKQAPYRTYVLGGTIPKGSVPTALYWDTDTPYHYVRLVPLGAEHDLLLVGGNDHKVGHSTNPAELLRLLEVWAKNRFPMVEKVTYSWSGQVYTPVDVLGYIGPSPWHDPGVYLATGYAGNGMTYSTIASLLLRDLVLGKNNPWSKVYSPTRHPFHSFQRYMKENATVISDYADWVTVPTRAQPLHPGTGRVIRKGARPCAEYRDVDGTIHVRSAVCPHMGCIVRWNSYEGTFDCPCHGSRFTGTGTVISGPANHDLAMVNKSEVKPHTTTQRKKS